MSVQHCIVDQRVSVAKVSIMLSYVFLNAKPGVGKTTSAVYLAHALHEQGLRPLLVDGDPGKSALRWSDLAEGFPFGVIALGEGMHREIDRYTADCDAVVIDAPQIEDHLKLARSGMRYAGTWIVPVAPSGVEVDRMAQVADIFSEVQDLREEPADEVVLLNRTNRAHATRTGPDADVRNVLTDGGYHVLGTQIPHLDDYRQSFGVPISTTGTAYETLAVELVARAETKAVA